MRKREPIPILREDCSTNNTGHVQVAGLSLKTDRAIATTSINNTHGNSTAELAHSILMAIPDDLEHGFAHRSNLGVHRFVLLDKYHSKRDQCTLAHEIRRVL